MNKTRKYFEIAVIVLALFSGLLIGLAILTGAFEQLNRVQPVYFALSAVFFLLSVLVWLFGWAFLVVNRTKKHFPGVFYCGIASIFGSLTPIQLGADALRSIFLKNKFNISLSDSFSASMIVKGLKFSGLALVATGIISIALFFKGMPQALFFPLLSGLIVVLLAVLLFLLPLNKRIGFVIASLFGWLSNKIFFLKPLEKYFKKYSNYLNEFSPLLLSFIFFLVLLSWLLEFLSLYFVFVCLGLKIPVHSLGVLFVLIALLERAPLLPRGIGLVEAAGFAFLSFPLVAETSLSTPQIASVLVIFDVSRLIIPTLISIVFYSFFRKSTQ